MRCFQVVYNWWVGFYDEKKKRTENRNDGEGSTEGCMGRSNSFADSSPWIRSDDSSFSPTRPGTFCFIASSCYLKLGIFMVDPWMEFVSDLSSSSWIPSAVGLPLKALLQHRPSSWCRHCMVRLPRLALEVVYTNWSSFWSSLCTTWETLEFNGIFFLSIDPWSSFCFRLEVIF